MYQYFIMVILVMLHFKDIPHFCLSTLQLMGNLNCFHFWTIMNNAVVNICAQFFLFVLICFWHGCMFWFPCKIPRSDIAGPCNNFTFNIFSGMPRCFPKWLHHFTLPSHFTLYAFYSWGSLRSFPVSYCYRQRFHEHSPVGRLVYTFKGFFRLCAQKWNYWAVRSIHFQIY